MAAGNSKPALGRRQPSLTDPTVRWLGGPPSASDRIRCSLQFAVCSWQAQPDSFGLCRLSGVTTKGRAIVSLSCGNINLENLMTRLIAFVVLSFAFAVPPASAAVYCKTVGVPKGCVARPPAPPPSAVVYCKTAGVPKGCVARPVAQPAKPVVYCKTAGVPKGCVVR